MVLTRVQLKNYRGFLRHTLPLGPMTILVGRNNAGKSTIAEALRLLSIVTERYTALPYLPPPEWTDLPKRCLGVSPSLRGLAINLETVFHQYSDPPAIVEAEFSNGASVEIYIGPQGKVHAVIRDRNGKLLRNKSQALRANIPTMMILPQLGPVAPEEVILSDEYVESTWSSTLASQHFRNQLRLMHDTHFQLFRSICQGNWNDLQVEELINRSGLPKERLHLEIRDHQFVGELATMGSGLQMWLQIMWFLTYSQGSETVILDEPDVYMHADLQRRLVRLLKKDFQQVILTTHSVEIISEADPTEILIVDRTRNQSRFAGSLPIVQRLVDHVGSSHNINLTKLWGAKKFLCLEGMDLKLLRYFHDALFPEALVPLESIPNLPLGGWSQWSVALGASQALKNAVGQRLRCYCIFDSDYHTASSISQRLEEAKEQGLEIHVWSCKEIENLFLIPSAIIRRLETSPNWVKHSLSVKDLSEQIEHLAQRLRQNTLDSIAEELYLENRSKGLKSANQEARKLVGSKIESGYKLSSIVSGKELFSRLSEWAEQQYGINLSARSVAMIIKPHEVPYEARMVISSIESGGPFINASYGTA